MTGKVYSFAGKENLEEEARRWLVRLDGDARLSESESTALREWAGRSPAHRRELLRLASFWRQANVLTELAVPVHAAVRRRLSWQMPKRIAVVLGCLALAGFVSWFVQQAAHDGNGIYGTVVGEQRVLDLEDGSTVVLNTDSQLQVDYAEDARRLRLLRGEAHFDVAKNIQRPFEVFAGGGMVRAVGTSFSVYLKDRDVSVAVTEGTVALSTIASPADASDIKIDASAGVRMRSLGTLTSGQTARFSQSMDQIQDVPLPELERRESWRDGILEFSGEPLGEVVAEINRYTPQRIEIADPALEALKVGGRFKVGDLEQMFGVLESSFGIEVVRLGSQHIELRRAGPLASPGSPAS